MKFIGLIEINGGIYSEKGIDVNEAKTFFTQNGTLEGFPGVTFMENRDELFHKPCDILVPAALE